jgi:ATP-dependent DNA helicase DinG
MMNRKSRRPIVISTNTKALQNQIMEKEKPMIEAILGFEISVAVAFGRPNYFSKRLLKEAHERAQLKADSSDDDKKRFSVLDDLVRQEHSPNFGGKFDEFDGRVDEDIRSEIRSDSKNCKGPACPTYDSCYYYEQKRLMATADIVVINHHLLLADVQLAIEMKREEGFLPEFNELIIDEAHVFESVAANMLTIEISWKTFQTRFDKIFKDNENENQQRGILKNIPRSDEVQKIIDALVECRRKTTLLFESSVMSLSIPKREEKDRKFGQAKVTARTSVT